jgi:predicted NBD/HSP70 family sugar kinase
MEKAYLAFDVGGTTIKYALLDAQLHISQRHQISTEHNQNGHILKQLIKIAKATQATTELSGIGVSTAGIVDEQGTIQYASGTIPGYIGTELGKQLREHTGLSVSVINDVDAALMGELGLGIAKGCQNVYSLALGTGIGGAYWLDGKLIHGAHRQANAIGYYPSADGTTYEQQAATVSLQDQLKVKDMDVVTLFTQARSGSSDALAILESWASRVATGIVNVILTLDPALVVIGGAVAKQGEFLEQLLTNAVIAQLPPNFLHTEIRVSQLSNDAQLIGAVVAVTQEAKS